MTETLLAPINFKKWIDDHREYLKPPVGNRMVWKEREFIVMVVGGPNQRTDFHVNQGEEFFYQIEGDMVLRVICEGKLKSIPIRAGEVFLLPKAMPHSPQRPAGSVGLVIERERRPEELDGFQWYCPECSTKLYEEFIPLKNIEKDLPPVFNRFYENPSNTTCPKCAFSYPPRSK